MKNIVGVKFKNQGKIYFFDPKKLEIKKDDIIIVDTAQGEEYSHVVECRTVEDDKMPKCLKNVIRIANKGDHIQYEECKKKEKEAFEIAKKKIKEHKLDMTLSDVEFKFDKSKAVFNFTANGRIDFRELVKDLAAIYKTRIELRQLGVRDEVKKIGGNGVCGRELCCCAFLKECESVSIKMAKEQNLSLNPAKISGNCGRLMCCLKYENEVYEEKVKKLPKIGAIVKTEDGEGEVDSIETLKERVRVKFRDGEGFFYKRYDAKDLKVLKNVEKQDKEEIRYKKELAELEKKD